MRNARASLGLFVNVLLAAALARAEEPAGPELKLMTPVAVSVGSTTRVTLRGLRLDQATEVWAKMSDAPIQQAIVAKNASPPPNKLDALHAGDTEVQIDLNVPAACPAQEIAFTVKTGAGESAPLAIRVLAADVLVSEQEPNNGYSAAQPVALGKTTLGSIQEPKDVDVYRIHALAGQTIRADVTAAQLHVPMDALLWLCDSRGTIVATVDDCGPHRDPSLEWTAPADGDYFMTVLEANDMGSALHQYLLNVKVE